MFYYVKEIKINKIFGVKKLVKINQIDCLVRFILYDKTFSSIKFL